MTCIHGYRAGLRVFLSILLAAALLSCAEDGEHDPSLKEDPVLRPHQLADGRVLFSFRSRSIRPELLSVSGDFTWKNRAVGPFVLRDNNGDGVYRCAARIDPGQYMYRFLVNDRYPVDPLEIQTSPVSGLAGSIQVQPESQPRLVATFPDNHSLLPAATTVRFTLGGNLSGFEPVSLRIVVQEKPFKPDYDPSSGTGSFTIPAGTTGRYTFSLRALNSDGSEVLNEPVTLYILPADNRPAAVIPAGATGYRVLYPFFGPESQSGRGTLANLIDKLDYLNDGKKGGKSLGITHLFLHAVYPTADLWSQAPLSFEDYARGASGYELTRLAQECRKRGIKLVLHYNTGYCSNNHPWFQDAFGNLASSRMRWFHFQDSRHTRYSGFMGDKALPLIRASESDLAQAYFQMNIWFWVKNGIDGFYFEHASLQEDPFWEEKLSPLLVKGRADFILAQDGRMPAGRNSYLLSGPANVLEAPQYAQHLLLTLQKGDIRELAATFKGYSGPSPQEAYLKPTSTAGFLRPASVFTRNSHQEALLGVALTGAGVPIINYGDELGIQSPAFPRQLEPAQMPWNTLPVHLARPAGTFHLARTLIQLRKENEVFRRDTIDGTPVVFQDDEKDEPHALTVRWRQGDVFYLTVCNPGGVDTRLSREFKIPGLPDGKYVGRELLTPDEAGVRAEAEKGSLSVSRCPTQGRGFLIYRFTKVKGS